jgi:hypothetical protein
MLLQLLIPYAAGEGLGGEADVGLAGLGGNEGEGQHGRITMRPAA